MTLMLARIICQTFEWEVDYFTAKEKCYFGFCFLVRGIQTILILAAIVAPFASAGIRPVVNRLNEDTTKQKRPRILRVLLTLYGKMI